MEMDRGVVQIVRNLSLGGDIGPDEPDIVLRQPGRRGDLGCRHAVFQTVEADIHLVVRKREIELFLRLRHGIGVRCRRAGADFLRDAEMGRELIDL